jgi:hypothetical protein
MSVSKVRRYARGDVFIASPNNARCKIYEHDLIVFATINADSIPLKVFECMVYVID